MGSYSTNISEHISTTKVTDQRVGIDGDVEKFASQSAIVDSPLAVRISSSGSSKPNVNYGGVTINSVDDISTLVKDIMTDNQATVATITAPVSQAIGLIESIKAPLSQYMPYAVLAVVLYLILKFGKKL